MSAANIAQFAYFAYLAKPKAERRIYRLIRRFRTARILAVGLGDLVRVRRMLQVAQRFAPDGQVQFTGIDLFELRPQPKASFPIIKAHRELGGLAKEVRLVPGDLTSAIPTIANSHPNIDLLLLGAEVRKPDLAAVEYYLPRMLHAGSVILHESRADTGDQQFALLPPGQFQEVDNSRRRAA